MDGEEALALLRDEDNLPDAILLDVMMPGMSGYDVRTGLGVPSIFQGLGFDQGLPDVMMLGISRYKAGRVCWRYMCSRIWR